MINEICHLSRFYERPGKITNYQNKLWQFTLDFYLIRSCVISDYFAEQWYHCKRQVSQYCKNGILDWFSCTSYLFTLEQEFEFILYYIIILLRTGKKNLPVSHNDPVHPASHKHIYVVAEVGMQDPCTHMLLSHGFTDVSQFDPV